MNTRDTAPTAEGIARYRYLLPMLESAIHEMRDFAKKKPDGIVSSTKIKILNRLLIDLKEIIKAEESASYLEPLSEEELPQNSDAVLILGQYLSALESFERRNTKEINYRKTWITQEWLDQKEKEEEEEFSEGEEDEEEEEDEDENEDQDEEDEDKR